LNAPTPKEYGDFVAKVKSQTYFPENVTIGALAMALSIAHNAGEYADVVKRSMFYGKQDRDDRVRRLNDLESMAHQGFSELSDIRHLSFENKDLLHGILGVIGESGEFADALQQFMATGKLDKVNLLEEIGDQLWYLQVILRYIDKDLGDALAANIAKLSARYPDLKFSQARSEHRDLEKERKVLEAAAA
jgi:NTP pyrophosphatase (non-canonical NTP hydrolase)